MTIHSNTAAAGKMTYVQLLLCLSVSVLSHLTYGKELCNTTDVECTTRQAQNHFNVFVTGIQDLVESSDPLYLKKVDGDLPALSYRLSNLTLTGLRQCQVTQLRLNSTDSSYQYDLLCPHLVLNYHHKAKGLLGAVEVDVNGWSTITLGEYILKIRGYYGTFISKKDQKLHYYLNGFNLETELMGKITVKTHTPLHSDRTKANLAKAYIDQNGKEIETYLKFPTMEKFITKFLRNLDIYLKNFEF